MGNTNFQTIHQMGAAISNMVKQATGRDDVQNIDMEHITVAQNHHYEEIDLSGQVVSFQAGEAGLPFEKMVVQIKPVQSGSGDPSPDNIRPITGWTMVNVYQAGQNMEDARVFRFPFPSKAGTVYGGTLNVLTGEMVVDRFGVNPTAWVRYNESNGYVAYRISGVPNGKATSPSNVKPMSNMISEFGPFNSSAMDRNIIQPPTPTMTDIYLALIDTIDPTVTPVEVTYLIKTPIIYHLSQQEITTLLGQNYIWADTGDIEVKFTNVKEWY